VTMCSSPGCLDHLRLKANVALAPATGVEHTERHTVNSTKMS
jgi:hypothetical protein